jgi:hypothetical protein
MTAAVGDMQTAYTDAAGRADPDAINLLGGLIGGSTFTTGLYTWGSDVYISDDIYFDGAADDVFIMQVSGNVAQCPCYYR